MRIINNTDYRKSDLRKLFMACIRHHGANPEKRIEVNFHRGRSGQTRGRGRMGGSDEGRFIWMWIDEKEGADPLVFARVFEHELMHNLGVRHEDMDRDVRYCQQEVPWADGLQLRKVEKKEKVVPSLADHETHAQKLLAAWEKKLKRAKTYVKKYKAKVRYYEKKRSAAGGN